MKKIKKKNSEKKNNPPKKKMKKKSKNQKKKNSTLRSHSGLQASYLFVFLGVACRLNRDDIACYDMVRQNVDVTRHDAHVMTQRDAA